MREAGQADKTQATHVYLETLENAEEQGKEPDETGRAKMGGL